MTGTTLSIGILLGMLVICVIEFFRRRLTKKYVAALEAERLARRERHEQGWAKVHEALDDLVSHSQMIRAEAGQARVETEQELRKRRKRTKREIPSLPTVDEVVQLQEIPGIGDALATELLREFGSIEEIRRASAEDLVEVEGIGPKLARRIKKALR